jgi:hypothetical protein
LNNSLIANIVVPLGTHFPGDGIRDVGHSYIFDYLLLQPPNAGPTIPTITNASKRPSVLGVPF